MVATVVSLLASLSLINTAVRLADPPRRCGASLANLSLPRKWIMKSRGHPMPLPVCLIMLGVALPRRWLLAIPIALALFGLGIVTGVVRIDPYGGDRPNDAQSHAITLAAQLYNTHSVDFTAAYRTADGTEITLTNAHKPDRMAATTRDWRVIIDRATITECHRRGTTMSCTRREGGGEPMWQFDEESTKVASVIGKSDLGLVLAEDVAPLLWDVNRLPPETVSQRLTMIGSRAATCVTVTGPAEPFEACVSEDGLLAHFTGTLDGQPVGTTLIGYDPIAYANALRPPKGSVIHE
jgi:hypothetical protein